MLIKEISPDEKQIEELIELSVKWKDEDITRGYIKNEIEDITDKRIFVAEEDDRIIGYVFAKDGISKNYKSFIPDDEHYFGIEELYVISEKRNMGIGKQLMDFARKKAKEEGYEYILLSTSTKDWNRILDFYISKCDMTFYSASLVEKI